MFRVIFIFLILGLSLYGVYNVFSPLQSKENTNTTNLDFDSYLSEALERNTEKNERVSFDVKEFIGAPISQKQNTTDTQSQSDENTQKNNYIVQVNSSPISGNFGTPETHKTKRDGPLNCDGGLLYDPCLVVGDPIPASGNMYFGSDKA